MPLPHETRRSVSQACVQVNPSQGCDSQNNRAADRGTRLHLSQYVPRAGLETPTGDRETCLLVKGVRWRIHNSGDVCVLGKLHAVSAWVNISVCSFVFSEPTASRFLLLKIGLKNKINFAMTFYFIYQLILILFYFFILYLYQAFISMYIQDSYNLFYFGYFLQQHFVLK